MARELGEDGRAAAPAGADDGNGRVKKGKTGDGAGLQAKKRSRFEDRELDTSSTEMYFHYYSLLQQQQNMLADYVRTGSYHAAIMENSHIFKGKIVVDVGAGTGVLSLFAAMAGAKKVYAIEASAMALHARALCEANKWGDRVEVVQSKVEDFRLPEEVGRADILISEPMGTLLVNERMLESYVAARDLLLKPDGWMFPSRGTIHVAPFYDDVLHSELAAKSHFWLQKNFYGINLSSLFEKANDNVYQQVVVDAIPPNAIMTSPISYPIDFTKIDEEELHDIVIPLYYDQFEFPVVAHGLAAWFDVEFGSRGAAGGGGEEEASKSPDGSSAASAGKVLTLTTGPGAPTTHWFQIRCVLKETLKVLPGQRLEGELRLQANARQSYDIRANVQCFKETGITVGEECAGRWDLKDPYYRQMNQPR